MSARKDIITEEVYTRKIAPTSSTEPFEDSPGDSEADAGAEFQMGMEYMPNSIDDEEDEEEQIEDKEESELPEATNIVQPSTSFHRTEEDELPESAKVISANQPAPWMDREKSSDTN